jgi:hypothetical protein
MFRFRTLMVLGAACGLIGLGNARADEVYPPAAPETAAPVDEDTYEADHPADDTEVNVHTPPPVIVQPPAAPMAATTPVVVEPSPVNVVIAEEKPRRTMTISVGGGVSDFTQDDLRDRTGLNAAYEARLAVGTNSILGLEAAYVGTAGEIETLGLDDDAMLISNGAEGLARINLGTFDFQPYIVGGASWIRYNVVNSQFNSSDVRESDDVLAVPLGGGFSSYLGDSGLVLDARFTYRMMFDDELIRPTTGNSDGSSLDNWMATLKLGYAF